MLDWIVYAILSQTFFALEAITDKISRVKYFRDSTSAMLLIMLAQSFPVLILPFSDLSGFSPLQIILALLAGAMTVIPFWLYSDSLKKDEISRVAPLWQTIPLFVLILAFVFLGEKLPGLFYLAFILILAGSLLISGKNLGAAFKPDRVFWMMTLASLGLAAQAVLLKFLYLQTNVQGNFLGLFALVCLGKLLPVFGILLLRPQRTRFILSLRSADKRFVLATLSFGTIGVLLYNYAVFLGSVTVVEVLSGFYPFFILLFAFVLSKTMPDSLDERLERKELALKLFAATLMFVGLALFYYG